VRKERKANRGNGGGAYMRGDEEENLLENDEAIEKMEQINLMP
jgi:hypothetical protein